MDSQVNVAELVQQVANNTYIMPDSVRRLLYPQDGDNRIKVGSSKNLHSKASDSESIN